MDRKKLQDTLQSSLDQVRRDFNSELNVAAAALMATNSEVDRMGREQAYEHRYAQWKNSSATPKLFNRIAIAWDRNGDLTLRMLSLDTGTFETANWPADWERLRRGLGRPPFDVGFSTVFELPRFGTPPGPVHPAYQNRDRKEALPSPRGPEQDWLILEADPTYIATNVLPDLLSRHLGANYQSSYQIDIVQRTNPSVTIFKSGSAQSREAAASVTLFDVMPQIPGRGGLGRGPQPMPPAFAQADSGRGRWLLSLRLNAGSLETIVARARRGNLAISAAILLLMLITGGALVRLSRQAQRLAQIEMDFVTSVSHELRTPLTVIRTAAFNLRRRLANNPTQVERYGNLIREESEKLSDEERLAGQHGRKGASATSLSDRSAGHGGYA